LVKINGDVFEKMDFYPVKVYLCGLKMNEK